MRELFTVFPGNKDDNWARRYDDQKQNEDKFVDETIENIVANATHLRKLQELNKKKEQKRRTFESKTFPYTNCTKLDAKKSFQLENFNLAPAFIVRKRKLGEAAGSIIPDVLLPGMEQCEANNANEEGQESLQHFDPVDDASVRFPLKKCPENIIVGQPVVSPIPDFIAKDFPLDFADQLTPRMVVNPKTTGMELMNVTKDLHHQPNRDRCERYLPKADVEEPVKNSVFWLYRSFPHIA